MQDFVLPKPVREMFKEAVAAAQVVLLPYLQTIDSNIVQIHCIVAPPDEVIETMHEMSNTQKHQMKKYPLVALFEDITVDAGRLVNLYGTTNLNWIVATETLATYKSEDREIKSFIPILRPIHEEVIRQLKLLPYFHQEKPIYPMQTADRKRWGRDGLYGTEGNVFQDRIDAIEVMNQELTLRPAYANAPTSSFN